MRDLYTILKGVPLPSKSRCPFAGMKKGDMFELLSEDVNRVGAAARRFTNKNPGFKFTLRRVPNKAGVHGCWRLS